MSYARNASLSAAQSISPILDLLDRHKQRLLAVVESKATTPEDRYEALRHLASLTGALTRTTREVEVETQNEPLLALIVMSGLQVGDSWSTQLAT